jgi:membrane carboxypeptidase/penicillin-binding protein
MKNALSGRKSQAFPAPPGVVFATIDPETGQLAGPYCPKAIQEAYLCI